MKKFKKFFAVMLSLALVLGMAVTVSAAGTKPVPEEVKNYFVLFEETRKINKISNG